MRKSIVLAPVAAVALIAPASALAASHVVVPFRSASGISLKMTPMEVVHRIGKPSHTVRVSGKIAEYDYANRHLSVQFDTLHHPIESDFVGVNGGSYHTIHGVHLGESVTAVRHALGKNLKKNVAGYSLYKGRPGSLNSSRTDFGFFQGKLTEMDVQYVLKDF